MGLRTCCRRILRDVGARRRRLLGTALVATGTGALLKALTPVVLGVAIDRMLTGHGGAVLEPLLLVGALLFAGQALDVMRRLLVENVATAFECDNRTRAYAHLLRLPLSTLGQNQVGALQGNANGRSRAPPSCSSSWQRTCCPRWSARSRRSAWRWPRTRWWG